MEGNGKEGLLGGKEKESKSSIFGQLKSSTAAVLSKLSQGKDSDLATNYQCGLGEEKSDQIRAESPPPRQGNRNAANTVNVNLSPPGLSAKLLTPSKNEPVLGDTPKRGRAYSPPNISSK